MLKIKRKSNFIAHTLRLFAVVFMLLSLQTYGAQSKFSKELADDNYLFHYQWRDHNRKQQTMSFAIPQQSIFNRYRDFSIYQPHLANEYVNNALRKRLKKSPLKAVKLTFREENNHLSIDIKAQEQLLVEQAYRQLAALKAEIIQEYLAKKYYHQFTTPDQQLAVKPDHGRIALESVPDFKVLKPLILEKVSIKNIRKVSNFVLSFVQSIPYAPLESRVTSSGAGFNPPLKLLWENQGDCDSKVTLTLTILRALMPRIRMALVYIDNHALIGLDIAAGKSEQTVSHNGFSYVLAEPTGPALLTLGNIAPESEQAINSGYYTVEPFHAQYISPEDDNQEEDELTDDML